MSDDPRRLERQAAEGDAAALAVVARALLRRGDEARLRRLLWRAHAAGAPLTLVGAADPLDAARWSEHRRRRLLLHPVPLPLSWSLRRAWHFNVDCITRTLPLIRAARPEEHRPAAALAVARDAVAGRAPRADLRAARRHLDVACGELAIIAERAHHRAHDLRAAGAPDDHPERVVERRLRAVTLALLGLRGVLSGWRPDTPAIAADAVALDAAAAVALDAAPALSLHAAEFARRAALDAEHTWQRHRLLGHLLDQLPDPATQHETP